MSSKDCDSWDIAERILEAATVTSTLLTVARPNKVTLGLAVVGLIGRIVCALIEPPKCPRCKRRMRKDANNRYYVCKICGLVKKLG